MLIDIVFWTAIILLGYTHVGYPLLLWTWSAWRVRAPRAARFEPTVSVLVVAYNEAAHIQDRIDNLLALDYPRDRLEIVVASDGSTDDTVLRARRYHVEGVFVLAFNRRRGKSVVLNQLIPQCEGEIVVLADARQQFDRGALRALMAHFVDSEVGAAGGELMLVDGTGESAVGEGVGFYWKYEKFIRRNESRIDSTVGVTGAIYAIRRELFEPIPADTILDDVLIPMRIVRRGYRVTFASGARAYDRVAETAEIEFRRKVRTLAGNFQLFVREPWLLNRSSNRLWIQTVSHKLCRLLSPLCLAVAFGANLGLLLLWDEPFYRWTFGAQTILYAAATAGCLTRDSRKRSRWLNVPYVFCLLNWATLVGFWRFVTGHQHATWERAGERETPATAARQPERAHPVSSVAKAP